MKNILITGGAGFIGSHVVRWFLKKYPAYVLYNLDSLTYAGNLENLSDIEDNPRYHFIKGDIVDKQQVHQVFQDFQIDSVIHLAAESHVDRSIMNPTAFVETNVNGTVNLLNAARTFWNEDEFGKDKGGHVFLHVSTDEVYGSLGPDGKFTESFPYNPQSPYAASKAASDHFVRAYNNTYGLPAMISNCSNNFGPNQFPEKLIPLIIHNARQRKDLPVYGEGMNVRDWIYVEDHVEALDQIFHQGERGKTYNVGGDNEWKNIELVRQTCQILDRKLDREKGETKKLIRFVKDRAGHDFRYAIDSSRLRKELAWEPRHSFEEALNKTVEWYLANDNWLENVTSGAYQHYYQKQYIER